MLSIPIYLDSKSLHNLDKYKQAIKLPWGREQVVRAESKELINFNGPQDPVFEQHPHTSAREF